METYLCPDCGALHDDPGEAVLGLRVRCLDCLIEIDLVEELALLSPATIAA